MTKIDRRRFVLGSLGSLGVLGSGLAGCAGTDGPMLAGIGKAANSSTSGFSFPGEDGEDYQTIAARRADAPPPTMAELMKAPAVSDRSIGSAKAKVTIIEYASLTCPVCHAFHKKTFPTFKKQYIDTGKVRWIVRDFPIGRASGRASLVLRCAPKAKHFDLLEAYLSRQKLWVSQDVRADKIYAVAKSVTGMTPAQFGKCVNDVELAGKLGNLKQQGREFGVIGTPTFFIGGKQYRGALTMAQMQAAVDPLLAGGTAKVAEKAKKG